VTVLVVGAGIAGLACARELVDAGVPARVVERDRVVGGRLASKRIDGRYADIGAAYLTADDHAFRGRLDSWRVAGLAQPWTDTLVSFAGGSTTPVPAPGPMRWSAPGGLRSLAEDLAAELDVTLGLELLELPQQEDPIVLAMPGPQAERLITLDGEKQQWSPVLAAVLTYPERVWADFRGAFVNDHPILATLHDDGDRRGDRAPVLVAHSTAAFAQPEPREGRYAKQGNVYLAGDAFGKPKVQTAWLSGRAAARDIIQSREIIQSTER
jgi:renalase